jgi:hypothetical protein
MKITISDQTQIQQIQEEFNRCFPYLRLEFFSRPHKPGASSSKKQMKGNVKSIGECRTIHKKGRLSISPVMTVNDLEQVFSETYGLSVQVFRKSGKVWLETTATDGWTLEEQNRQGEELSRSAILE